MVLAAVIGGGLLLWLLWRGLTRMADRPRIPMDPATYVILAVLCGGLLGVAALTFGISRLFGDHAAVEGQVELAQVRCEPAAPGRVRLTYTPKAASNTNEQQVETTGEACSVSARLINLRSFVGRLGVGTLARVTQVGDQEQPGKSPAWLLPEDKRIGPLAPLVRDARSTSVTIPAEVGASYRLLVSSRGLELARSDG